MSEVPVAVGGSSVRSFVTSTEERATVCERLMSIQTVMALMCLFCIVASTASSSAVTITSCDDALDKTRTSGDNAAANCFSTADQSLRDTSIELLTYSSIAVDTLIFNYFDLFIAEQRRLNALIYDLSKAHNTNITWDWIWDKQVHFDLSITGLGPNGVGVNGIGVNDDMFLMFYNLLTTDKVLLYNDGSNDTFSYQEVVRQDGTRLPMGPLRLVGSQINGRILINKGVIEPGQLTFDEIKPFGSYAGSLLVSYQKLANGDDLMIYLSLTLPKVSQYLSQIALRTRTATGSNARIYTCVRNSWVKQRFEALGKPDEAEIADQRGILSGVSDGEAVGSDDGDAVLLKDVNATDPLIAGIAAAIHDYANYSFVAESQGSTVILNVDNNGTDEGHFIQVKQFYLDGYNIDWWLVTTIDVEYVLGDVNRQKEETLRIIEDDKSQVRDTIASDRIFMIGIVISVTFVLVLGSFAVTWQVLLKIKRLQVDMRHVAEMDLDFCGQSSSGLLEVARMQKSFEKMKRNLKEFRAYVPSSLLSGANTAVVDPPTGEIALVFTDIQGSTQLWDKSSSGMNIAMEIHNEIIRTAILNHMGYEVKTIGDAFMVAFTNPVDAMLFCFEVQLELQAKLWPHELEIDDQGLRVRMGCSFGDVILEENPLTGRSDYRGTTVITASRMEGKALAGTVCITDSLCELLKKDLASVNNPAFLDIGDHELRGLSGKRRLHLAACQQHSYRVKTYKPRVYMSMKKSPHMGTPQNSSPVELSDSTNIDNNKMDVASCNSGRSGGGSIYNNPALPPSVGQARNINNKKTGLSLVQGQVTVAVLRLINASDNVFDNCNFMVRTAADAASQTDGIVGSVTGGTMTVVWNASKNCKLHATAAMRFAAQLQRRVCEICTVGIATGSMLHGNVGTQKKRFQTVFGRPLQAAEAAADNARRLGSFCLLADCTPDNKLSSNSAISPFLRIVDSWLDKYNGHIIVLYEALTSKLMVQLEDAWGTVTDGNNNEVEVHNKAFNDVIGGKPEEIEKLVQNLAMHAEDVVLKV
eukprot:TRINITY_DN6423_c0_g1_i2.p1 TRINITY_DN6423_c0_g1~~TRINITY_DN6423_c0_g1_i2.p1  ORF type:complete len:1061 (+),score=199.44 TRINITY_DN6423_c0_g1_i2:74-3184(+)